MMRLGRIPLLIIVALDATIFFAIKCCMASGFCYIVTNKPRGVLYIGVTTDLARRTYEPGFTSRYGLTKLVFYEEYPLFMDAVQREKNIKRWRREWKIELVEKMNPSCDDLYYSLV